MPTDNPINPIRNCNPKNTKLLTHTKQISNKILKPSIKQNHTGPNYVTYIPKIHLNPNII